MDFLNGGCIISYLHKDEITHELTIGHLPVNPASRRNSSMKALSQTAKLDRSGSLKFDSVNESDSSTKLAIRQRKTKEMEQELGKEPLNAASIRLSSRCKVLTWPSVAYARRNRRGTVTQRDVIHRLRSSEG